MEIGLHGLATRVALLLCLGAVALGATGCKASFCAGSGCDSGKIYFGSNWKQQKSGGSIDVVGKSNTFKLTQNVASSHTSPTTRSASR